jgi:2-methylcitrate dehydratase PrpD
MFTEEIARFITEISYEQLPAAAIDAANMAILDWLGVALAGSQEIPSRIISEYVKDGSKPEAGVIGSGFKTATDQAAWANGTKAHALDYDDYFFPTQSTPYHPTTAILPAVLAIGEKYHLRGKDVLLAYTTGFEVEAMIATACGKQQYDLGWHTTSTLGSLGAAAAVAKIMKLDDMKIRIALGIAASLCGGLRKNFGTMTKPLHAGNAARSGVVAATLAQNGFTAHVDILDGRFGFCEVLGAEAVCPLEVPRVSRGDKLIFNIVSPGIAYKPYPTCAYSHWAIEAALSLKREAGIEPEDIIEVECRTSSALPSNLRYSQPKTALEGKFSLQFCVATALIDGEVLLRQVSDEKVRDSAVQELIRKIKYVHPPEMGSDLTNPSGEIVVKLKNGKVYSRRINRAKGDPSNPPSKEEMTQKYRDCAGFFLSPEDTSRSLDLISHLNSISDIGELMDILTFKSANSKRPLSPAQIGNTCDL